MKRLQLPVGASARIAALTGVIFFAATMATPDTNIGVETPSVTAIEQFYVSKQQDLRLAFLLTGLAYAFFLVFLAVLRTEFRRAEEADGRLSALVTGAGLLVAGFHVLGTTLWAAPGLQLDGGTDPALVGASTLVGDAYRNALIEISTFWRGVMLAAVALLVLRYRALPRWLGWLAAVLAMGALIGSIGFIDSPVERVMVALGFGSYIGFHFWVLLASVALTIRRRGATTSPLMPRGLDSQPELT